MANRGNSRSANGARNEWARPRGRQPHGSYRAIIETEAAECADLLRAYLEGEHYALRFNAAVTLVHLGDEAGAATLRKLGPNRQACSGCLSSHFTDEALEKIGYTP